MQRLIVPVLLGLVAILYHAPSVQADQMYEATGSMLMPGFFNGNGTKLVFLAFESVTFTEFTSNETARLQGVVRVTSDNSSRNVPSYNLRVLFNRVIDTSGIQDFNPAYRYYTIQSTGMELVNPANPSDITQLMTYPTDNSMPFQVGVGANNHDSGLGAAGWVGYTHQFNGQTITGNTDDVHGDFVMDLTPIPEPSTMALALSGLVGLGFAMRHRFPRKLK